MHTADALDDCNRTTPLLNAIVAALAVLCAAALALGTAGGLPWEGLSGRAAAGTLAAPALSGEAAARPLAPVLCFRGPRGEPVDFPVSHDCS